MEPQPQAALEQEVFNMKMRIHEYEERLKQVNLHGATGEILQKENGELKAKLMDLERNDMAQKEQIDSLTMICMKTRTAIESLQNANIEVKQRYDESQQRRVDAETKVAQLTKELIDYKEKAQKLAIVTNELDKLSLDLKTTKEKEDSLSEAKKELEEKLLSHNKILSELDMCKQKLNEKKNQFMLMEEKLDHFEKQYDKAVKECETMKVEMEKRLKLELAVKEEKLEQQTHKACTNFEKQSAELKHELEIFKEIKNNLEAECERYKLRSEMYAEESKEARNELYKVKMELKNARQHEEMELRKAIEKHEADRKLLEETHEETLRDMQKASTENLNVSRQEKENLALTINELRRGFKAEIMQLEEKNLSLSQELETTRRKWQSSITHKREQKNTQPTTNSSCMNKKTVNQHSHRERIRTRKTQSANVSVMDGGNTVSSGASTGTCTSSCTSTASGNFRTPNSTASASRMRTKRAPGSGSSNTSSKSLGQKPNGIKNRENLKSITNKTGAEVIKKKQRTDKTVPVASRFMQSQPKFR